MEHATVQGAVSRLISTDRLEANPGGKNHRSRTWRPREKLVHGPRLVKSRRIRGTEHHHCATHDTK